MVCHHAPVVVTSTHPQPCRTTSTSSNSMYPCGNDTIPAGYPQCQWQPSDGSTLLLRSSIGIAVLSKTRTSLTPWSMFTVFQGRRKMDWSVVSLARRGLVTIKLLFQLDSIGFAWNMPRFTLNADTRANVIRRTIFRIFFTLISVLVSSKFHKLLDSSPWLLLPDTSIINAYQNAINKKFPIIDVRTMLYIICWYIPYLTLQQ